MVEIICISLLILRTFLICLMEVTRANMSKGLYNGNGTTELAFDTRRGVARRFHTRNTLCARHARVLHRCGVPYCGHAK